MGFPDLISPAILVIPQSCVGRGKRSVRAAVAGGLFRPHSSTLFIYPTNCLAGSLGAAAAGGLSERISSPAN